MYSRTSCIDRIVPQAKFGVLASTRKQELSRGVTLETTKGLGNSKKEVNLRPNTLGLDM